MFRHTYVEPLPAASINEQFARKEFAAAVALQMAQRIFAMTIDPDTCESGRWAWVGVGWRERGMSE
jgi:hypothetical protein